jgi:hypothetical protein
MTILERHIEELQARYPDATVTPVGNGTHVVVLHGMPLPAGWNRPATDVAFVVPAGYPQAAPDCFWVNPGLALSHGGPPQNTGTNAAAGVPGDWLWFSWHPQGWNSNSSDLSTYANVVRRRLVEIR